MAEIVWTESALNDLDDIGDYIAKDSIRYAELTVAKLFESPDILETHPLAGKMVPELQNEAIRRLIMEATELYTTLMMNFLLRS